MVTEPPPVPAKVRVIFLVDAVAYGPTSGPPPGAPIGATLCVEVSPIARAKFRRPLPVCAAVPAGSVLRASLPIITAFEAPGSFARSKAAAPATNAAEVDVPLRVTIPPPGDAAVMETPGAAMKVSAP
jgi:hypothetical protein